MVEIFIYVYLFSFKQRVLELDSRNFTAYLMLAAAHQDDSPADAVKFLKQAVTCTNDPSFAYVGLLKCASNDEIPDICRKLLQHAPNRYPEVYKKLETAALITKNEKICIEILANELKVSTEETRNRLAYASLLVIFLQSSQIDNVWTDLFSKTLEHSVADKMAPNHTQIYRRYLKVLYQQKRYELLLEKCLELLESNPKAPCPLELLCKVYADTFEQPDFVFNQLVPDGIIPYADDLLQVNATSSHALLAKGLHLYSIRSYVEARDCLNNANNVSSMNVLCLKTLAATHFQLGAYTLAEYYYSHIKCVNVEYIQSLVEQQNEKKSLQALDLVPQVSEPTDSVEKIDLIEATAKASFQTRKGENGVKCIEQLLAENALDRVNILLAHKHRLENESGKALEILLGTSFESSRYYLILAQCHFDAQHYQEALNFALMATKMEPYNSNCYFWLGQIYTINGDTVRSRKCFEKSVFLNPQHEQSVILLSTIYRQLFEWDLNLNLLQTAAQAIPNRSCKWATLQLGFHNLGQNEFEEAIGAFRTCLRLDPKDLASWEGLADSYLKRGSFSSALKIYQKICELTNNKFYPRLQVANIKSTLRYYNEAIVCYNELLLEEPNSVPSLKGIAEVHLRLGQQYFDNRLLGRAKHHVEQAVKHLIVAIQLRSNFICLWRLLGNSFDLAASFPVGEAVLSVPGSLANEAVDVSTLKGDQLYEFASKFYCRALKINATDELLWYELAINYYNRAIRYGTESTKRKLVDLATEATKHVIKLSPGRWKHWNLLGVICTTEEINNPRLAQHCFIKALELDKKSAVVWTNLGVLYLSKSIHNASMANAAFTHAQQSEPSYSNAWTGQAQIAELVDSTETIDLLKHSISLSCCDQSALRYAHWVCTYLNDSDPLTSTISLDSRLRYAIENMHAIPTALDALTSYCRSKGADVSPEGLTFLGILHFKQRNWNSAINAFNQALVIVTTPNERDKLLCNVAYSYLKNYDALQAVQAFSSVSEATYYSSMGLAYAQFKAKQYESSYATYQSTLEYLARDDLEKSFILIAISSMVYVFQGESDAKSVLFQCIGLPDPPVEALLSACSLGILHDDMPLSQLVLKELTKYESDPKWCHHVAFLTAQLYVQMNETKRALLYLYSKVHSFPNRPLLRQLLASFLLRNCKKDEKHATAANRMIEGTITLERKNINHDMSSLDISKLLALASEATRCINPNMSRKLAQKAVHLNPACKEAWSAHALVVS